MDYSVIILCAGSGTRTGLGYNKMFYQIDGVTVYQMVTSKFLNDNKCKEIIVVSKENEQEDFKKILFDERIKYVVGGNERQDSVYLGLQAVTYDYVLIHDGARPFVTNDNINDLLECLKSNDACLLMVPCVDTVKEVINGEVKQTLIRANLMQAQTPQAFKTSLIKEVYQIAKDKGYLGTDDASLVEVFSDKKVISVKGDYRNKKITTANDLS